MTPVEDRAKRVLGIVPSRGAIYSERKKKVVAIEVVADRREGSADSA